MRLKQTRRSKMSVQRYDILILPGGKAPEAIRKEQTALAIARDFFDKNKPVAAICHGPQTLISAGLMKGKTRPVSFGCAGDEGSGADYEDKEVIVDGNLITSRQPSDLRLL